jgi:hypothetical protein
MKECEDSGTQEPADQAMAEECSSESEDDEGEEAWPLYESEMGVGSGSEGHGDVADDGRPRRQWNSKNKGSKASEGSSTQKSSSAWNCWSLKANVSMRRSTWKEMRCQQMRQQSGGEQRGQQNQRLRRHAAAAIVGPQRAREPQQRGGEQWAR